MSTPELYDPALMPHLIISGLEQYDDRPCMHLGDTTATYAEVRARASQYQQALASRGLGVGSRVAVISANRPEVLYNIIAMQVTGCCGTALHPMGSVEDHAFVLEDAEVETLVYDPDVFGDRAAELAARVPGLKNLLAFGPSDAGDDYSALADTFTPRRLVAPDVSADDVGSIAFTGGTTGKPKGVLATYRSSAAMTMAQMAEWEWPEESRVLIPTPLSHAGAALFVPTLQRGGALYVMQGFTPDLFFDTIEEHKITSTFLVPVMIYYLLDSPRAATADMSSMETIFYGASPMSPTRLAEGIEKWGPVFYQIYGQAEAPMVVSHLKRADHDLSKPERLASCGRPSPWVQVALLDDENQRVAEGEPGEICVRGPLVMKGYHNRPEATAEAFDGGWLHTGDVGRFDEEGFLYIVDRKKDMIVTGGFNVFPKEVEDVISAHPSVAQVAVIGVPDERWGESVKAVVVLRPEVEGSDILATELMEAVKAAKGSVQTPKSVDFSEAIPLSAVGKPDKKELRKLYWGDTGRGVN